MLPLLVWMAVRFFKQRMRSGPYLAAATIALIIQCGISLEIFASTVIFGGVTLVIAWVLADSRESRTRLVELMKLTTLALAACALGVSPWLWAMLQTSPHVGHCIFKPWK